MEACSVIWATEAPKRKGTLKGATQFKHRLNEYVKENDERAGAATKATN
jgi:hypothetical protein